LERLYLAHFGLRQAPFSITPDPAFFFAGAGRGELLRGIEYSIRNQEGIVVVGGEVGTGKTMLCRMLLAGLAPDIDPIYIASPLLRRREMLATVLQDLGGGRGPDPMSALQHELIRRHGAGRRVVLFADEAHVMPAAALEQIRLLSNLETDRHKLLQIVLFGQPELEQRLGARGMRPIRDRIVERFRIEPLCRADAAGYVTCRLQRAGRSGGELFNRGAIGALWNAAGGLARRMNLLADKALLSAFVRRSRRVDCHDVQRAALDLPGAISSRNPAAALPALAPPAAASSAATPAAGAHTPARNPARTAALLALMAGIAACAPIPPTPSDVHLQKDMVPAVQTAPIPATARSSLNISPPAPSATPQRYTLVVNNVPATDVLATLARDAGINVDVDPAIHGSVSINAIDQTLVQILNRMSTQIDMRYTLDGNLLQVVPDTPFVRVYHVDYLNMARDTNSRASIATQVSTTGGVGDSKGAQSSVGNNSGAELANTSNNHYWQTLVESLKALLQETDKMLPAAPEGEPVKGDGKGEATGPRFREAASVIAQPETGVLAVRATERQQARVQEFLDTSVRSARRQVLIEATIAEVELSNDYEQGIDWSVVRTTASGVLNLALNPAGSVTELPGGTPVGGVIPTLGLISATHSSGNTDIAAALRLLDSFGNTRVLSSPKISVLNNQTALIKVVDNLVYFQLTADYTPGTAGSPTTFTVTSTPNTVPVGFLMTVTPQISGSGEVVLNLRPTISRLTGYVTDPGVALSLALARQTGANIPDVSSSVPEIQTREMESVIKVGDGQIAVLGGLMREESADGEDAIPGAKRLPLFGNLFRNRSRHSKKSELVIFLRPVIVRDPSLEGDYRSLANLLPDNAFLGAPATR
jgi:MSHA type pilus biogenesis protein MshL